VCKGAVTTDMGCVPGDSRRLDGDFDVGNLIGVVKGETAYTKLINCSELRNWETFVNFYVR
jgi:hypothetical protein